MGNWSTETLSRMKAEKEILLRQIQEENLRKRLDLSDKITMVVINKITADLIRPGPVAEDRECYEMAQELNDMSPTIKSIISDILQVELDVPPK